MAGRLGPTSYLALLAVPFLPIVDVNWGLFGDDGESTAYLQTLWQVVGAALGLSVAMIGFVFEAFMNAASRSLGGSLREFARTTRLQAALRLGFAALIVDGMVLLGLGHQSPAGWAAACAIVMSGLTLGIALPFVFMQTLRGFEFEYLVGLRRRKVEAIVHRAIEQQLRGQAGDSVVHQTRALGVGQGLWPSPQQEGVVYKHSRVIRDVKLGPLRRLASVVCGGGPPAVELVASLDQRIAAGRPVMAIPSGTSRLWRWTVRATVRTRRFAIGEDPNTLLTDELERLHEAAKAAIRGNRKAEWQLISEVYASALLAMPRAAATMSVPFAGAVARPGPFGLGPLDRVQHFLYDEMTAAIDAGDRELALEVAYFPARIASDAIDLNAPGLVQAMLSLYPTLYMTAVRS